MWGRIKGIQLEELVPGSRISNSQLRINSERANTTPNSRGNFYEELVQ